MERRTDCQGRRPENDEERESLEVCWEAEVGVGWERWGSGEVSASRPRDDDVRDRCGANERHLLEVCIWGR